MHAYVTPSLARIIGIHNVTHTRTRVYSALAQKIVHETRPEPVSLPRERHISQHLDPFALIAPELNHLRGCLIGLLSSAHPGLTGIAESYFLDPRKQLRSSIVLLIARATNGLGKMWHKKRWSATLEASSGLSKQLDRPLQLTDVLYESNPAMTDSTASFADVFRLPRPIDDHSGSPQPPSSSPLESSISSGVVAPPLLLPTQIRLAQIVEMIHVASLLHDRINSSSETNTAAQQNNIDNKLAILGGDFLLGRASTALSQLGENEVVELIASVISNQVEGEILRMDVVQTPRPGLVKGSSLLDGAWDVCLSQIYLKTASLMAKSARGAVVLGGSWDIEIWKDVAYAYGRNLGIAHQLIEDACAFEADLSDLRPGLAAPILFAWEEYPEMQPYIRRNFSTNGDLEAAFNYVSKSSGIERTRSLARTYAQKARDVLHLLPEGNTRLGLDALTRVTVD